MEEYNCYDQNFTRKQLVMVVARASTGGAAAHAHTAPDLVPVGPGGPQCPAHAEDVPLVAEGRQPLLRCHPTRHERRYQCDGTLRSHRAQRVEENEDTGKEI